MTKEQLEAIKLKANNLRDYVYNIEELAKLHSALLKGDRQINIISNDTIKVANMGYLVGTNLVARIKAVLILEVATHKELLEEKLKAI